MPLRIIRAQDPIKVENIITTIMGAPGGGKSSLAYTSEAPLLLDFDRGAHRAAHRKDTVPINSWADIAAITVSDLAPYKTIVLDTAGRALEFLSASIMDADPKMRNKNGGLTLQGFGALKTSFQQWLSYLSTMGKDVVLICHSSEQRKGDDIIERLDVQGGSKDEIYKVSDAMGRLLIEGGKRKLTFDPSDASFGKNPGRLPALEVDEADPQFLAGVIQKIKDALNTESEEQKTLRAALEKAVQDFSKLETAEQFTKAVSENKTADIKVKSILATKAKERGFTWSRESNAFVG